MVLTKAASLLCSMYNVSKFYGEDLDFYRKPASFRDKLALKFTGSRRRPLTLRFLTRLARVIIKRNEEVL